MIEYITSEQVLFIHYRLIEETGGKHGILDLGLLQSAVARPQATFDKHDLYPDLFTKAAALLQSIIGNHPFIDGNKRTAITAAAIFLRINGHILNVNNLELERFTMKCALGSLQLEDIANWFKEHTE